MFKSRTFTRLICFASAVSLFVQGNILSAFDESPKPLIQDVELSEGGVLVTRVIDAFGNPLQGQEVVIQFKGKAVASATSNENGLISVSELRPGMHLITTSTGSTPCRFWGTGDAPPSAVSVPAVIAGTDAEIIRGQFGAFNLPMVVYAGITAAAMVIAIDAENDADDANDSAAALRRANAELEARVRALETASP